MDFPQKTLPPPFFAIPCSDMTIDALRLISDQITSQVQTLVRSLEQPEARHPDTLKYLHTAFAQGLAIVGGLINAAAPINRIPQELLATIFALSPGTHSPEGLRLPYWPFELRSAEDQCRIPKICRYWRELALARPTLWNTVVVVSCRDAGEPDRDFCFGRSIYLPNDASVDLTVHFKTPDTIAPFRHGVENMVKLMLTNSPRIRQLHVWDTSPIRHFPSFLQSFDATALEHCTIVRNTASGVPHDLSPKPGRASFFSNGGARLRSLCLVDVRDLPENAFPSLTLLKIGFVRGVEGELRWKVEDLVDFLAGSPKLEEVYLHDIPYWGQHADSRMDAVSAARTASFPHLQYLAFTLNRKDSRQYFGEEHADTELPEEDATYPIESLLSRISIPATCHLYLVAPVANQHQAVLKSITDILASVRRHVLGKDAVSHMFLRLSEPHHRDNPIQLVFPQGSLRLRIPRLLYRDALLPYLDFFHTFRDLFATTAELRVHYTHDAILSAFGRTLFLPAVFPKVTSIAVIRDSGMWWPDGMRPTLGAGLVHLNVQPPAMARVSTSPSAIEPETSQSEEHWPLDTLWTSVESSYEIGELEAALAARAALGMPIRRLVVTIRFAPEVHWDANDVARLRALGAEEVVVVDAEVSSRLEESDWLVRLPERYDLPPSISRDWPAMWGKEDSGFVVHACV